MKRSFFYLISLAAIVSLTAGCTKDIPVENISVEPATLTLDVGATSILTVTVTPENADYNLTFTSSDEQIATVSEEGVVEALSDGTATITVTAGHLSAKCEVTVIVPTLNVSPALESVVFEGVRTRTQEFAVTTTASKWAAEPDADWLSVEYTETGFILKAEANLSMKESREGSVTVSAEGLDPVVIPVSQQEMRMYLAGNDNSVACYWINGEKHEVGPANTWLSALAVEKDGAVHCVGRQGMGQSNAAYWNEEIGWSIFQPYDYCLGNANGVAVDDETGDVYFTAYHYWYDAGQQTTVAGYHKNLEWQPITTEELGSGAGIGDIIIENGDIYISFEENGVSYYSVNDEWHELELAGTKNYTSSMYVKDGDVYVGGWYSTELDGSTIFAPCYWKNGEAVLIPVVEYAQPYAIFVDEEDNVYLAGSKGVGLNRCATYWKNDEPAVELSSYSNGVASSIDVVDNNIIVVGYEGAYPDKSALRYWINGEETVITDGTTSCSSEATVII